MKIKIIASILALLTLVTALSGCELFGSSDVTDDTTTSSQTTLPDDTTSAIPSDTTTVPVDTTTVPADTTIPTPPETTVPTPPDTTIPTPPDTTIPTPPDTTIPTPPDTTIPTPPDTTIPTPPETTIPTPPDTTIPTPPDTTVPSDTTTPVTPVEYPHNYDALVPTKDQFMIIYEPNGGTLGSTFSSRNSFSDSATHKITATKADGYFYQTVTDSYYLCPHSLGDKDYLKRDGYVLYGYNTMPDGSGDYYGCGWNVPVAKGEKIVLYAMWAKESQASLFSFSNGKITGYSGNEDTVVIPASIKGSDVTEIASGAFKSKKMKTVIFPKGITVLNSSAFKDCKSLEAVYIYDLVTSLPNDSFSGCTSFSTMYINNANNIRYVGNQKEGSYHMKFQRLLLHKDDQKVILISGSNAVYGIDSQLLKSKLGGKYEIINYGTNFYVPSSIYVDVASHFVKDGDIVVVLPEEVPQQWGDNRSTSGYAQFFPAIEGCMELISYIDLRNYSNIFTYIAKYNGNRKSGSNSYESVFSEAVDEYGDFSYIRTEQASKFGNTSLNDWFGQSTRDNLFTTENIANLNRAFDGCVAAGAKIYISFSVVDEVSVTDTSDATLRAYASAARVAFVDGKKGRAVISKVADYVMEHECFYNSMHHLLTAAAKVRTERLANDILAQLKKDK